MTVGVAAVAMGGRRCWPPRRLILLLSLPVILLLATMAALSSFPFGPHGPRALPSQPRPEALVDGGEEEEGEGDGTPANDDPDKKTDPMPPHLRVVHLDLKGAPPKLSYLRALFPLIAAAGANALLIEYEDAFPFHGMLANASSEDAYTEGEIRELLSEAARAGLEVIPLVQTFGHLEFALKLPEFKRLRELEAFPQEICPSNPDAFLLVQEIIRQVLALHSSARWLHIGCDEVFHLAECTRCEKRVRETLRSGELASGWAAWAAMDEKLYVFAEHVKRVAEFVKEETTSKVSPIIWDDMLRRAPAGALRSSGLGDGVVEVMVWAYAEDASSLVPPRLWRAYAPFRHLWAAGAFKGANKEDAYLPDMGRRVTGTLSWTALLRRLGRSRLLKSPDTLRGFVLTGWSRYDHFAVLCELLPPSIPSLLLNLLLLTSPSPGSTPILRQSTLDSWSRLLSCPDGVGRITPKAFYADESYWATALEGCSFPGANALEAARRWPILLAEASLAEDTAERVGWLTEWHARRGFSSPWRVSKALQREVALERELKRYRVETGRILSQYVSRSAAEEWLQQKVDPVIQRVEKFVSWARELVRKDTWKRRPLSVERTISTQVVARKQ
ncbi:hexosaminidase D-like [Hetaerina americana]|uniref:hexosaminidase D-like n=1 Tax=Hetaerina americana TaxID=62018 RepID=UPI003A7F4D18